MYFCVSVYFMIKKYDVEFGLPRLYRFYHEQAFFFSITTMYILRKITTHFYATCALICSFYVSHFTFS